MPRLSLYKPEKGNNYRFIDRQISQMFQVGGTDVFVHKFLGPKIQGEGTADQPVYDAVRETNIQDLLFLENRDRKYEPEIYRIRGIYNVQNVDFNLSQFGLFIDNDTVYMTVHINDFIKFLGRKPLSGDVMEMPHLRDDFALNDYDVSLPRYYVIEDVGRASEGFSATWYPHLYRLKLHKITDNQQFSDILDQPAGETTDLTLRELLSTRTKELEINDAILNQAEADAPMSGYETRQFYTLAVDPTTGKPLLNTADMDIDSSSTLLVSENNQRPVRTGYTGYLVGDGYPVNGYDFGHGIQFPEGATENDFFLRTDFMPNRLFRFEGTRWIKIEDAVRMNMTNNDTRQTQKTSFINNDYFTYVDQLNVDFITLEEGVSTIDTNMLYVDAPFVVLKIDTLKFDYATADYPTLLELYDTDKLRINLPDDQTIPITGQWMIGLYNHREAQRQSLSKALKPKADL
jgi:hypothetical protein